MGRLSEFLRLLKTLMLPHKHWTLEEKMSVWVNMAYAASGIGIAIGVIYEDITTRKKETLREAILRDGPPVNKDQLFGMDEIFLESIKRTPAPLGTKMSEFYFLHFKPLENRSEKCYPV